MNEPQQQGQQPKYTPKQILDELIAITVLVGGESPKEVKVTKEFRSAFIKQRDTLVADFDMGKDNQITNLTYRGVKLV